MQGRSTMTKEEVYLIRTVINSLRYLRGEWHQNVELETVIRNSNVLRLLLVDGNLERAWRLCGYTFPIRVRAITLSDILNTYERSRILTAFAGGALHHGARWALGIVLISDTDAKKQPQSSQKPPKLIELSLQDYVQTPCMIIRELDINRLELIKYVANKLGGTHIDFTRKSNKPLEQKFLYLDSLHNYEQVDKNIIPYELLSIGQELVNSRHIQRLMKRDI